MSRNIRSSDRPRTSLKFQSERSSTLAVIRTDLQPHCHETHHLTQGLGCVCVEEHLRHLVITAHYVSHIIFAVISNRKHLALWGKLAEIFTKTVKGETLNAETCKSTPHDRDQKGDVQQMCVFTGLRVLACLCTGRNSAVVYYM